MSVCIAPMGAAALAQSQGSPPARIANEWDGLDHQPTRNSVRDAEHARGYTLSAKQKQSEDQQLDAIQRQLLPGSAPAIQGSSP